MTLFIPLRKVDAAQRLVYGQIDETPDRADEVFDYKSSKPLFQAWSQDVRKATDGKSLGNVRAMHGKVAAGKLENISFDDAAKRIEICARIVDDAEWQKVEQGVYTGFSPGGRYVSRWQDGDYTRYTAQPSEISIVDLPCIPSASFTMVKIDGIEEQVAFRLRKVGARNSQADLALIQAIHDSAVALGASCSADDDGEGGDEAMDSAGADDDGADKAARIGNLAKVRGELSKLLDERDALKKRVAELESRPVPGGPALRALSKGQDVALAAEQDAVAKIEAMPDGEAKSLALIKLAHRHPMVVRF